MDQKSSKEQEEATTDHGEVQIRMNLLGFLFENQIGKLWRFQKYETKSRNRRKQDPSKDQNLFVIFVS